MQLQVHNENPARYGRNTDALVNLNTKLNYFYYFIVVFRQLVRLGSFPACWRQANVTPIPKGPPSSSAANYRPIFITSVLSKVFERLVSVRLGRFMERSGVIPTTQFAYRKGLGT